MGVLVVRFGAMPMAAFGIGAACGAWLSWRAFAPVEATAHAPAPGGSAVVEDRAPEPKGVPVATWDPECASHLAACEFELALAGAQDRKEAPEPVPWPEDLVPGFSEQELRASLDEAFASDRGVEVVAVDCDEFPCLVALLGPVSVDLDGRMASLPVFQEEASYVSRTVRGEGQSLVIRAVSDRALVDRELTRTRVRLEALDRDLRRELFGP